MAPIDRPQGLLTLATVQRPLVDPGEAPDLADERTRGAVERTDATLQRVLQALEQTPELNPRDRTWILIQSAQLYQMIARLKDSAPLMERVLTEVSTAGEKIDDELRQIATVARENKLFTLSVQAAERCSSPTTRSYQLLRTCEVFPNDLAQLPPLKRDRLLALIETSAAKIEDASERNSRQQRLAALREGLQAAADTLTDLVEIEPSKGE